MVQELTSFIKRFGDPTTRTNTPKFVEEVDAEIMKIKKTVELFQTMAIVNLNMGNLSLELNTLKNKLVAREKEKAVL